jgi:hypothetical protein
LGGSLPLLSSARSPEKRKGGARGEAEQGSGEKGGFEDKKEKRISLHCRYLISIIVVVFLAKEDNAFFLKRNRLIGLQIRISRL